MKKILLILLVVMLGLSACSQYPIIEDITVQEVNSEVYYTSRYTSQPHLQLLFNFHVIRIIDVRTTEEYATGHLNLAKNIDFNAEDFEKQISKFSRNNIHYIYCTSGGRSRKAVDIMATMGFTEVYNMLGGINAWIEEGHSIIIGKQTKSN